MKYLILLAVSLSISACQEKEIKQEQKNALFSESVDFKKTEAVSVQTKAEPKTEAVIQGAVQEPIKVESKTEPPVQTKAVVQPGTTQTPKPVQVKQTQTKKEVKKVAVSPTPTTPSPSTQIQATSHAKPIEVHAPAEQPKPAKRSFLDKFKPTEQDYQKIYKFGVGEL